MYVCMYVCMYVSIYLSILLSIYPSPCQPAWPFDPGVVVYLLSSLEMSKRTISDFHRPPSLSFFPLPSPLSLPPSSYVQQYNRKYL